MAAPGEKLFCVLEYHTSRSVVTVQPAFRAKYAKDLPTDKTIRVWYRQFAETGCLYKPKSNGCPLAAHYVIKDITHINEKCPAERKTKFMEIYYSVERI